MNCNFTYRAVSASLQQTDKQTHTLSQQSMHNTKTATLPWI